MNSREKRNSSLEVLLNTHFPNCADSFLLGVTDHICNAGITHDLEEIIATDRLKYAISCFEPFKPPAPDGIISALLQHTITSIIQIPGERV